ncbi:uncharacterized protein UTRI_02302 [Ustilago trichophora]|uniref:Uncharacterized protein n=1 Tax=Ustilago trichophora TaxID=86804 RepID=A0A5C3E6E4_9BASI|nr:uncharacterized protein UTRI_02302 [Ustilago trichophora]
MPTSFGRRPGKKPQPQQVAAQPLSTAARGEEESASSSRLSATVLGKRPAEDAQDRQAEEEEAEQDDGLTAEERAANREAEQRARERRAKGLDSDDDDDDDDSDQDSESDDDVGPPPPPSNTTFIPSKRSDIILPPMSSSVTFRGTHSKTISSLAVDPSGSRFALGSYDHTLSLYDFGGMSSSTLSPFRLFEPGGSYPVLDLSFSANGGNLLVVSGTSEAKVFTRDGAEVGTCKRGDMYLRDMRNTKGHVSGLTCGMWDPIELGRFFTGGSDSTVRIWDVGTMQQGQDDLIVVKSKTRGNRTKVTAIRTIQSTLIAAGLDGSLAHWDLRTNLNSKPRGSIDNAHETDTVTSSIAVNQNDGYTVVTRGGDGTVKLWDLRKFRTPLAVRGGMANNSAHTSVVWDPMDGRSILTCVSAVPTGGSGGRKLLQDDVEDGDTGKALAGGKIVVLDSTSLDVVQEYPVSSSPIRLHWSPVTDQLFCTHQQGTLSLYYDSTRSTKGIILALNRTSKTSSTSFYTSADPGSYSDGSYPIFEGNTIDMAQSSSESAKRRKLAKIRQDPISSRIPQKPVDGPGKGGRIGAAATQHVVQTLYGGGTALMEDPREALLKYANKQGDNDEPEFTKAWKDTQPNAVYSKYSDDEKE